MPNPLTGRYLLNLLKRKWQPSWQLSNLILRLKQVHELSIRSPARNVEALGQYCERLTLLNIACKDLVNHKGGAELEVLDATDDFVTMWLDLESLMLTLANRSTDFLNKASITGGSRMSLPNTVTSRMRATFNVPIEYPEDFKKKPANLWKKSAGRAGAMNSAAGETISMAQNVVDMDQNAVLIAAATGGTVATGPVGLAVAGAVHATVGSGLSARSSFRSHRHIRGLQEIKRNLAMYPPANGSAGWGGAMPCKPLPEGPECNEEHNEIMTDLLDYLINQKTKKRARKGVSAVPVVGAAEGLRGMVRGSYKRIMGTKSKARNAMTAQLTTHFMQCDCRLAQDIVSDLLSSKEKMEWLKWQDYDTIFGILKEKFKGS